MDSAVDRAQERTPKECFRLLSTVKVGRVAMTRHALPVVLPVTFTLDGHNIIIATAADSLLNAAQDRDVVVAFEADDLDPQTCAGWSVLVTGTMRELDEAAALLRAEQIPSMSSSRSERRHFVCITPGLITGRAMSNNAV